MGPSTGEERFVLVLSSGQRPRYRDDIIQAMALPHGGWLQFRYREKHVPADTFRELKMDGLRGCEALIAYLDASDKGTDPTVVPCRFARVLDTEVEGDFAVVRFEVGGFADIAQGVDLDSEVRKLLPQGASLPHWHNDALRGHFLVSLTGRPPGCRGNQDPRAWQAIVANLAKRADFGDCPFFYYLRTVAVEDTTTSVLVREGKYVLNPDRTYRADVVHYAPPATAAGDRPSLGRLEIRAQGNGIQPLTPHHLPVDSPYDVKRVYFRTTGEARKQYSLLSFGRCLTESNAGQETPHHDFELVLEVKGTWRRSILVALFIGLSLAVPRWLEILQPGPWGIAVGYLMSGLVTGLLVVFGLRKVP